MLLQRSIEPIEPTLGTTPAAGSAATRARGNYDETAQMVPNFKRQSEPKEGVRATHKNSGEGTIGCLEWETDNRDRLGN